MLHYWNLRVSWLDPQYALTSWARTGFVLLMIWAAQFGVLTVRIFAALISAFTMWQTIKLAEDLRIKNSHLAGVLFILQPLVFALSNDVMTEVPMSLGVVIALRLWFAERWIASCLLVSFLPLVRPEGFLLVPVWGLFLLALPYNSEHPNFIKRIQIGSLLAAGFLLFLLACLLITGDILYYVHEWSWAYESGTKNGELLHHFYKWFEYCGALLFPIFIVGIIPSLKKRMALPWAVWLVVIVTHSIFYWRGIFGSVGFMRIMACTASVTAIICLYGWNRIVAWIEIKPIQNLYSLESPLALRPSASYFSVHTKSKQAFTCGVLFIGVLIAVAYYVYDPMHYRWVLAREAADYIKANHLLADSPKYFISDTMVMAELNIPAEHVLDNIDKRLRRGPLLWLSLDREKNLTTLREMPAGTIGVWDDELGRFWHKIKPEEFPQLGYTILYRTTQQTENGKHQLFRSMFNRYLKGYEQEVIVVKKNGEMKPPVDLITKR